ncbi:MAG TPA: hypothetical protein VL403_15800 [Candidatus Kryptonia bacterium]|nr:hypothetical protein [Candidatus Kryptonia bacterium]
MADRQGRASTVAGIAVLLIAGSVAGATDPESAPPIVDQVLAYSAKLELTPEQIARLHAISERRAHTLDVLAHRLRTSEAQASAQSAQDSVGLMQEIGSLRVLSGAEALQLLSTAQKQRWVQLQTSRGR